MVQGFAFKAQGFGSLEGVGLGWLGFGGFG